MHLYYTHLQVESRGSKRILYLLVVDENECTTLGDMEWNPWGKERYNPHLSRETQDEPAAPQINIEPGYLDLIRDYNRPVCPQQPGTKLLHLITTTLTLSNMGRK
jgi:hypothetical protein